MRSSLKLLGILQRSIGLFIAVSFLVLSQISSAEADVTVNVLTVNPKNEVADKNVQFSLPGEIKPDDVLDPAGLNVDYNVKDAGYFLHGKVTLQPKETRIVRVKVRDVWRITDEQVAELRAEIERGYTDMGGERDAKNAAALRDRLIDKLNYIVAEEQLGAGSIDARIDTYRNHVATLRSIRTKAQLIDYWRTDASVADPNKTINYMVEVTNPTEKTRKVKQQHFLPKEVRPEYVIDRKGYEVRFDEKRSQPFLFKEDDFQPNEKRTVSISIQDVWFVPENELQYARSHSKYIMDNLARSKYIETAKALYNDVVNNLDLIVALQGTAHPDIKQHIGAYRLNAERFEQVNKDLDALEKLLARFRSELEKSKIKNVMQKVQQLKSLAKVSEAMFDKKPTVNAAWKLIGSVMLFLALFTVIHFVTWFLRSSREKKQEEVKYSQKKDESGS